MFEHRSVWVRTHRYFWLNMKKPSIGLFKSGSGQRGSKRWATATGIEHSSARTRKILSTIYSYNAINLAMRDCLANPAWNIFHFPVVPDKNLRSISIRAWTFADTLYRVIEFINIRDEEQKNINTVLTVAEWFLFTWLFNLWLVFTRPISKFNVG